MPARPDRVGALQTVLTILAVAAGGLLLFLVVLAAAGSFLFKPPEGMDPALAGLAPGKPAPAIEAEAWLNDGPPDSVGKPVLVQGWFYDCKFCWREAPEIVRLHERYGGRVTFVGLSPDPPADAERVREFVERNGMTYPVGYGALDTLMGFEAQAFPAIWLIGPDGKVLWNIASAHEQSLEEAIKGALATPAT